MKRLYLNKDTYRIEAITTGFELRDNPERTMIEVTPEIEELLKVIQHNIHNYRYVNGVFEKWRDKQPLIL